MTEIKPYGDWTDDGKIQLSFTLPMPEGERARQAAIALAQKMGFERILVAHMKGMGPDYTYFVVYGSTTHSVDPDSLTVTEREFPLLTPKEVNLAIREGLKRQLVVVGACTGTDAHTVGLDAILSMKGFAGDKGLEYYHEMLVHNLGSQVTPEEIVASVRDESADAVLISQVVTQRDAHIHHLSGSARARSRRPGYVTGHVDRRRPPLLARTSRDPRLRPHLHPRHQAIRGSELPRLVHRTPSGVADYFGGSVATKSSAGWSRVRSDCSVLMPAAATNT